MNDRLKWRMWSTHAGRYFDENNDAMLQNVFECMKQQICYDCQDPIFRKIYDRIAYNHIEDGMVFEQCTGLKDKNGKLIYEGDVVKLSSDREVVCPVVWDNEETGFCVEYKKELYRFNTYKKYHLIEVIGNIHENPDLLKVGGK